MPRVRQHPARELAGTVQWLGAGGRRRGFDQGRRPAAACRERARVRRDPCSPTLCTFLRAFTHDARAAAECRAASGADRTCGSGAAAARRGRGGVRGLGLHSTAGVRLREAGRRGRSVEGQEDAAPSDSPGTAGKGGTRQSARPSPRAAGDALPEAGPALLRRRRYPGGSADGADRDRRRVRHPAGPASLAAVHPRWHLTVGGRRGRRCLLVTGRRGMTRVRIILFRPGGRAPRRGPLRAWAAAGRGAAARRR